MDSVTGVFAVDGMHCASCGMLIDDAVGDLDGVLLCETSYRARRATVTFDPARVSDTQVLAAIADEGYAARQVTG